MGAKAKKSLKFVGSNIGKSFGVKYNKIPSKARKRGILVSLFGEIQNH
jgi:hypothetical protein